MTDFLKRTIPMIKMKIKTLIPLLTLPVTWLITPISVVPRKEAPFPQISRIPKYSPDFSAGIILAKWERDKDCTPPWNIPTQTANTQK